MSWKYLLSPPEMSPIERELLIAAFDSNWIAPAGPDLDAFERELEAFTGAAAAAGLSSGTAALHLALQVAGVRAGDDVLMPSLTFAASAFAASYLGARPCFVDVDHTWQLDAALLEEEMLRRAATGTLPAAVIAVDLYGSIANLVAISEICRRYDVTLIEDAAEALGATLGGTSAGRFGQIGVLSFNGNKIVTTGGGGAILSDDERLVERCRHLATQARVPAPHYEHHEIGYNYRLGNLNAAVGRGQLRTLAERVASRRRVRATYESLLTPLAGIGFQPTPPDCAPNHWLTTITIDSATFGATPAEAIRALQAASVEARPGFKPMHLQPVFASSPMLSNGRSDRLFETCVSLPSGGTLGEADLATICDVISAARH